MGKKIGWIAFALLLCLSCREREKHESEQGVTLKDFAGQYVSDGYEHRAKGFDWVSVQITVVNDSMANVSVRSRADNKQPTCTFDSKALFQNNNLEAEFEGKRIVFCLTGDTLSVSVPDDEESNVLYFLSSGGSALMGDYVKVKAEPDTSQLDKRGYMKHLIDHSFAFDVQTEDSFLLITPDGLTEDEHPVKLQLHDRQIEDSRIADLDSDGYPELLVFLSSRHGDHNGDLIGYSVNQGKSMSEIYYPSVADHPILKRLYHGRDSFAVKGNILYQYIPVKRASVEEQVRVQYKLVKGESCKQLIVENII